MRKRTALWVGAATAVALLGSACSGGPVDKSGGEPVRTLVLANNDIDLSGAPAVAQFIDTVGRLSGNRMTVEVVSPWKGGGNEGRVIRDVAAGEADLGWSGTRAFDTVGVDAFQPLHAPFLIPSYPAEAAVVKSKVARDLLASTRPLGLNGLALFADELRRPAAAVRPILAPSDFADLRFGTFPSHIQEASLRALGATPVAINRPKETEGLDAVETMWNTYLSNSQHEFAPYITGNVALWPRTTVLFANSSRLARLDDEARGWVTEAVGRAAAWSAEHAGDREVDEVAAGCSAGARVATATADQLVRLRAAAEPAYRMLAENPAHAKVLRELEAVVAAVRPAVGTDVPPECAYRTGEEQEHPADTPARNRPGRPGSLPAGTFRFVITEAELRKAGLSEDFARGNAGVWTWKIGGGRWSYLLKPSSPDWTPNMGGDTCAGYYDTVGDRVAFTRLTVADVGECAPPAWPGRFTIVNDGLRWVAMDTGADDLAILWTTKVWQKIG